MMTPNFDWLYNLGAWSIEGFWLPLLVWTVIAGLTGFLLRLWRTAPPMVTYAAFISLLLALPIGVLVSLFTDLSLIAIWTPTPTSLTLPTLPQALAPPVPTESAVPAFSWTFLHSLGVLLLVAGLIALFALLRLIIHALRLNHLRSHLPVVAAPAEIQQVLQQQLDVLDLQAPVRLIVTSHHVIPMTFGWRRPMVVVPASLLDDIDALRLTLLHELIHIRHADYLLQWIGNVVGALFAIHPGVWLLRRSIARCRELACDAAVLGQPHINRKRYATLLYQFALVRSNQPRLALSMAASHRELKNRIMAMKSHKTTLQRFSPRLVALTLAGLLLSLTSFIVACTDFVGPDPEAETVTAKLDNEDVFIVVERMPELIGGLEAIQGDLQYPVIAKKAGIEGRVFVQFVVDAQGKVADAKVVKSLGAGCDEEALRVVRAATFKPGIQDGKAVPVKMSIPVTFRLNGHANRDIENRKRMVDILTRQLAEMEARVAESGYTEDLTKEQIESMKKIIEAQKEAMRTGKDVQLNLSESAMPKAFFKEQ